MLYSDRILSGAYTSEYHKLFVWHQPRGFYSFSHDITLNHVCTRIPSPRRITRECIEVVRGKGRKGEGRKEEWHRGRTQTRKSPQRGREHTNRARKRVVTGGRLGSGKMPFHSRKEPQRRRKTGDEEEAGTRKRQKRSVKWCLPPSQLHLLPSVRNESPGVYHYYSSTMTTGKTTL